MIENQYMTFKRSLGLFICWWLIGFAMAVVIISVLTYKLGAESVPVLRVTTIIQDILVFLTPVAMSAVFISRKPLEFLMLNRSPKWMSWLLMLVVMFAGIPIMNVIVDWNASISLPDSLAGLEKWMKSSEEQSAEMVSRLLGGTTVKDLVASLLIIGVLTGVSEELFFRGMLQRIFATRFNPHVAIWMAAAIFSAAHFQFYGFVPRMLLGGFFGYLAWWSGSLWLPIAAHALNNSLVALTLWLKNNGHDVTDFDSIGISGGEYDMLTVVAGVVVTMLGIWILCRTKKQPRASVDSVK